MVPAGISNQSAQELLLLLQDAVCLFMCLVIAKEPKEAPADNYEVVVSLKVCSNVVFHWVQKEPSCSPDFACFQWIPSSQTEPELRTVCNFWKVTENCKTMSKRREQLMQAREQGITTKLTSPSSLLDHWLYISCLFLLATGPCGLRWDSSSPR